jgi:predicted O-methyltransferase YrrM
MSSTNGSSRRVSAVLRRTAHTRLVPVKRFLENSRMWRLWRGRNLQRRAMGPLDGSNEWSVIAAPRPDESGPSDEMIEFALRAVQRARVARLKALRERRSADAERLDRLSGYHYRILAGLAEAWGARRVVEIGTYRGTSALALLDASSVEHLVTYDLVAWDQFAGTWLRPTDFGDRLEQRLADLGDPKVFAHEADVLARADMIFVDASKDGVFEPAFLAELFAHEPVGPQLIVLDDIRVLTMIRVWRAIRHDKLDLTSFGHWSGTGIVVRGGFPPSVTGS